MIDTKCKCRADDCSDHLCDNIHRQFVPFESSAYGKCKGHSRVDVTARYATSPVNSKSNAKSPTEVDGKISSKCLFGKHKLGDTTDPNRTKDECSHHFSQSFAYD